MKNFIKINLVLSCLFLLTISACKREKMDFEGPDLQDLNGTFSMLEPFTASKTNVDFANGETAYFTARFSKLSDWTITITGATSKAKKIISGKSKLLDQNLTLWNGSTTVFPFFGVENCTATLKIDGVADSFNLPISIKTVKTNQGLLVADFETGINSKWVIFKQSGANMDFKIKTDAANSPQGKSYFNMAGTVDWDWLIGLVDFPATALGTGITTYPLSTNPDEVYFNVLVYGQPATNQSILLFQFREDENANGTFDAASEDEYDVQIPVNWEGWKLISIKYSDLNYLVNGNPGTPKGNKLKNPDKLNKVSVLHLADKTLGYASTKMDYMIFTTGKALEP